MISIDLEAIAFKTVEFLSEKFAAAQAMLAKACGKNSGILTIAKVDMMAANKGSSLQASLAKIHATFAKFCSVKVGQGPQRFPLQSLATRLPDKIALLHMTTPNWQAPEHWIPCWQLSINGVFCANIFANPHARFEISCKALAGIVCTAFCGDRIDQWQVDIIHFARPQAMLPRCCGSSWGATHSTWRESASRSGIFFHKIFPSAPGPGPKRANLCSAVDTIHIIKFMEVGSTNRLKTGEGLLSISFGWVKTATALGGRPSFPDTVARPRAPRARPRVP